MSHSANMNRKSSSVSFATRSVYSSGARNPRVVDHDALEDVIARRLQRETGEYTAPSRSMTSSAIRCALRVTNVQVVENEAVPPALSDFAMLCETVRCSAGSSK